MAAKIKKGDKVIVLTGRDKGRTGEVIEVRPADDRALVRGINMVKRHQRQTAQQEGGIVSKESDDPSVQPGAGRPQGRQADPRRLQVRRRGATTAKRCASPSVPELRSMADTQAEYRSQEAEAAEGRQGRRRAKGGGRR